jgi:type VI secretion system protein ImpA
LANPATVLRDVRDINFISTGSHARLSVRVVLVAMDKLPSAGAEGIPTQAEIEEVLRLPENASSVQAMDDAMLILNKMHTFLGEKVGYDRVPDLQPLKDMLQAVAQHYPKPGASISGDEKMTGEQTATATITAGAASPLIATVPGEIRTREDAVRMLETICQFIERTEPANPAPLFIRRGQRLMTKNFVEILQDLVPESLNQIKQITGLDVKKP